MSGRLLDVQPRGQLHLIASRCLIVPMILASLAFSLALASQANPQTIEFPPSAFRYQVDRWTIRDGLPQGEVTAIALDQSGALWVSTYGGIVRFDGIAFEPLSKENQGVLGNNRITALHAGADGRLWIGTESDGLLVLRNGKVERVLPQKYGGVIGLLEDSTGRLWLGTSLGAGFLADGKFVLVSDEIIVLEGLVESNEGEIWMASWNGLFAVTPTTVRKVHPGHFRSVACTPDGSIWAGNFIGPYVQQWRPGESSPQEHLVGQGILCMNVSREGNLWLGGATLLAVTEDGFENILGRTPLPPISGRGLIQDSEGNTWIGSGLGLVRLRLPALEGYALPERIVGIPRFIVPTDGVGAESAFYVGLYDRDLLMFNGNWSVCRKLLDIQSMTTSRDGSILATGSDARLFRIEDSRLIPLSPEVNSEKPVKAFAILETKSGDLWVGTEPGQAIRYRGDDLSVPLSSEHLGLGSVMSFLETSAGDLWVGAHAGLGVIHDGVLVRKWRTGIDLPGGDIRDIFEGPDGSIWAGSYGNGIYWLAEDGTLHGINVEHGLHENVVSRILMDDFGHLVLLGNRAISRMNYGDLLAVARGELDTIHPQVFSSGPGITDFEGNGGGMHAGWKLQNGVMWFPTQEGLVSFDPARLNPPLPAPGARITSLTVDGESWDLHGGIEVPPCERNLVFEFSANTLVDSERARFRYRLEGCSDEWIDCGTRRVATYTRIPQGRYTFQVRASNRDGIWSKGNASIDIHLKPWAHETLWFRGLIGLVLAASVWGGLSARTRAARKRAQELEEVVALRTAELTEVQEDLEIRVEERTNQLRVDIEKRQALEKNLRESQRLEAVGRLAGGLAHDFNNYLTVVMVDCEVVLESLPESAADERARIQEIAEVSQRAADLTQQLLAYSRQQVLEPRLVDPNETIRKLHGMLRRLVREEIELVLKLGSQVGYILVDPGQFEQVIVNLVVNAQDASEGAGRIVIETGECRLSHAKTVRGKTVGDVRITVEDDGHGMAPETVELIFEPFFSTKPVGQGTGLGLASVSGIVEQSGGYIGVTSKLRMGTTFEVCFPVQKTPLSHALVEPAPALPDPGLKARVLVCEDQLEVRQLLVAMLESLGHAVISFERPAKALDAVSETSPKIDLLVSDISMPGMNGHELAKRMSAMIPGLRVLLVSGYSFGQHSPAALDNHIAFLQKPFGRNELKQRVEELLAAPAGKTG